MEVVGAVPNRTRVKRRKAYVPRVSKPAVAKPGIRRRACVVATESARSSAVLPGEISRLPPRRESRTVVVENERTR